ncbi:MAG: hypothetical protein KBF96_04965 [Ignavibacteria bacterium]|nr:hypothetical protein [Ignavibacteria bacterium]
MSDKSVRLSPLKPTAMNSKLITVLRSDLTHKLSRIIRWDLIVSQISYLIPVLISESTYLFTKAFLLYRHSRDHSLPNPVPDFFHGVELLF